MTAIIISCIVMLLLTQKLVLTINANQQRVNCGIQVKETTY